MGYHALIEKAVGKGADTDQRFTRWPDFRAVEKMCGVTFKLDVCALNAQAAKCKRFYAPARAEGCEGVDGLAHPWDIEWWCNPPWSNIEPWVLKGWRSSAPFGACYLPNDRAERGWWQKYVEPFVSSSLRYRPIEAARAQGFDMRCDFRVTNLDYRPAFDLPGGGSAGEQPMCGVVVLTWDRRKWQNRG